MQVHDDVILGLDIGVGSLGWALLEEDLQTGEQRLLQRQTPQGETTYALGVRLFHVPENAKTKELLNVKRRTARMQRRTTARRAQRMRRVRALLDSLGVPGVRDADAFHLGKGRGAQCDPWQLRREGLERRLEAGNGPWCCCISPSIAVSVPTARLTAAAVTRRWARYCRQSRICSRKWRPAA